MAVRYTLGKAERLSRDTDIQALFRQGKALSSFPVRLLWLLQPQQTGFPAIRAGFSAPKKNYRRSVDRARAKRLLRESWRLQRHSLDAHLPEGQQLHAFLILNGKTLPDYDSVFKATGKILKQLAGIINPQS
jgi:ribonuclease P protein component